MEIEYHHRQQLDIYIAMCPKIKPYYNYNETDFIDQLIIPKRHFRFIGNYFLDIPILEEQLN